MTPKAALIFLFYESEEIKMRFVFPVKSFRNLDPNLNLNTEYKRCFGYAAISQLPEHLKDFILPLSHQEKPTEDKILEWLKNSPKDFHYLLPTITIHTSHFVYDNRKGKITFDLINPETDGIVLNGNALKVILDNIKEYSANTPDGEIYVEFEFLSGLDKAEIEQLVSTRQIG